MNFNQFRSIMGRIPVDSFDMGSMLGAIADELQVPVEDRESADPAVASAVIARCSRVMTELKPLMDAFQKNEA